MMIRERLPLTLWPVQLKMNKSRSSVFNFSTKKTLWLGLLLEWCAQNVNILRFLYKFMSYVRKGAGEGN